MSRKIFAAIEKTLRYHLHVPKNEPSRVRFSDEQNAILKGIAAACDVSEVTVARWAVEALGDYWKHHQQRLLLPLRFHETFRVVTLPDPDTMILELPAEPGSVSGAGTGRIGKRGRKAIRRV